MTLKIWLISTQGISEQQVDASQKDCGQRQIVALWLQDSWSNLKTAVVRSSHSRHGPELLPETMDVECEADMVVRKKGEMEEEEEEEEGVCWNKAGE